MARAAASVAQYRPMKINTIWYANINRKLITLLKTRRRRSYEAHQSAALPAKNYEIQESAMTFMKPTQCCRWIKYDGHI
jgi:hypothetical protein